ncbi:hypothetical protein [Mucilaginibacter myungsuensis]|uniref:Uncharacterized protein n=1 Tax=Mucilaginibacter myungsuensis TaxID=649104 RepID=A0A929L0X6_9SPHI|nr:hypothetical protein [Mucilaginibacter myungsuensis]MBE9661246.1 hypothetical protein [Mucilaginibacter myungsuensis]MDN3597389.1 hypothetical protein [Mucilaginibacter myungsuensis]
MRTFITSAKVAFAATLFTTVVNAQKLPSKQEVSLRTPAAVKIDGKATEWDNKLQAYNNATEFSYTLANNDTDLYLTVRCALPSVIRRIMNGGISLNIHKSGKKNDPAAIGVNYPVFDAGMRFSPMFKPMNVVAGANGAVMVTSVVRVAGGASGSSFSTAGFGGGGERPLTEPITDSLMGVNNTRFADRAKNIGIKGIAGMDSTISVYNDEGFKAAGKFDNLMVYTYELQVPLKSLGLSAADATKFLYQLKINEVQQRGVTIVNGGNGVPGTVEAIRSVTFTSGATMGQDATDFWGEYKLAK